MFSSPCDHFDGSNEDELEREHELLMGLRTTHSFASGMYWPLMSILNVLGIYL